MKEKIASCSSFGWYLSVTLWYDFWSFQVLLGALCCLSKIAEAIGRRCFLIPWNLVLVLLLFQTDEWCVRWSPEISRPYFNLTTSHYHYHHYHYHTIAANHSLGAPGVGTVGIAKWSSAQ